MRAADVGYVWTLTSSREGPRERYRCGGDRSPVGVPQLIPWLPTNVWQSRDE